MQRNKTHERKTTCKHFTTDSLTVAGRVHHRLGAGAAASYTDQERHLHTGCHRGQTPGEVRIFLIFFCFPCKYVKTNMNDAGRRRLTLVACQLTCLISVKRVICR